MTPTDRLEPVIIRITYDDRMRLTGGSIAYTIAGDGPALLLIHGLGGTRKTWRHLIDDLARTHTVIAPDLPGHGESDPPARDYRSVPTPARCGI